MKAKRYFPEAVVSFYTEKGELVARSKVKDDLQGKAIDGEVLSIQTHNDLANDAGTFQITLAYRREWNKLVASNDLVIIRMRNQGEDDKKSTIMYGLVDHVSKSTAVEANSAQRVVVITGRNFAKAAINFEVGIVPEVETIADPNLGWLGGQITFTNKSAAQVVKELFDKFIFKYQNYEFSNGKTLKDMLKLELSSRPGEKLASQLPFVTYQGSMHSFLKEVSDEPFNQLYYEVKNGEPALILRETPFNEKNWKNLPLHTITDEDVVNTQIGRSDLETYTLYSVGVANSSADAGTPLQTLGIKPLWYEPYVKKYGLRRLHRFTNYAAYDGDQVEVLKNYAKDLFNWNVMNPSFYNGQIIVRGDNRYKVGDRLLYKSSEENEEYEFFIEGVSHTFTNFGSWTTTLAVTRGLPNAGKDRFSPPWGEYEEYEGGVLGAPTGNFWMDILNGISGVVGGGIGGYTGKYAAYINEAAAKYNVPAALIAAIIRVESNFNPRAVSPVGAKGLMQLMPGTAKEMGVKDPFDPYQNIMGGTKYLKQLLSMFGGDIKKALAAYNWGPGNVKKHGYSGAPQSVKNYVNKVLQYYKEYSQSGASGPMGDGSWVARLYLSFRKTSDFGEWRGSRRHWGVDLAAPQGTKLYALHNGVVVTAKNDPNGYGNYVVIQNGKIKTLYAHMTRYVVRKGQSVKAGQHIGYVGSTGRSTGPHLHLEYHVNGQKRDPMPFLRSLAN